MRDLLVRMTEGHEDHIRKLIEFKQIGVHIGAPTLDDIIDGERKSLDNIQHAIALLDAEG